MPDVLDLTQLPEEDRIAFYGTLFAMAAADGSVDKEEMSLIFETMVCDGMSPEGQARLHGFVASPPAVDEALERLARADERLRYGLVVNLVDLAYADDDVAPQEREFISMVQTRLGIASEQMEAIWNFVREARKMRLRGIDDKVAEETLKRAAAGLGAVGVPIAAVYFSGSVIGLSAAGITSGLAALGLGFGMVPGLGVAVVLGTLVYLGMARILDVGGRQARERAAREAERRAQQVIINLQNVIQHLVERLQALQGAAETAEANREAIHELVRRLRALQQLVNRRKDRMEAMGHAH
ncbi:MAG TPA: TerB family tellurite resistance protein [Candidatus Nitrosotenuis sp.]|nr:TerB family tellurite resistance protein [Candidatus Nitrosotenuis sp.]